MKDRREYYKKWRKKNASKVKAYEKTRRLQTNSRKRARYKVGKVLGKGAINGKDVHHKDGNPMNNKKSNLSVRKRYHGKNKKK